MKEVVTMIVVLLMFVGGIAATTILSLNDKTIEGVMTAMTSTISIVLAKVLGGKGGKNEQ
jgi:hypothetical protein